MRAGVAAAFFAARARRRFVRGGNRRRRRRSRRWQSIRAGLCLPLGLQIASLSGADAAETSPAPAPTAAEPRQRLRRNSTRRAAASPAQLRGRKRPVAAPRTSDARRCGAREPQPACRGRDETSCVRTEPRYSGRLPTSQRQRLPAERRPLRARRRRSRNRQPDAASVAPSVEARAAETPPARDTRAARRRQRPRLPPLPEEIGPRELRDSAMAGDPVAAFEVAARYAEGRGVLPDMPRPSPGISARPRRASRRRSTGSARSTRRASASRRILPRRRTGIAAPPKPATSRRCTISPCSTPRARAARRTSKRASELFRQAAEHGVRDSQFNLAILHARGLGVPQDLIEAYKWFGDRRELGRRGIRQAPRHHRRGAVRERQGEGRGGGRDLPAAAARLRGERSADAGRRLVGQRQLDERRGQRPERARRAGAEAARRERLRSRARPTGCSASRRSRRSPSSRTRPVCRRPARSTTSWSRRCRRRPPEPDRRIGSGP